MRHERIWLPRKDAEPWLAPPLTLVGESCYSRGSALGRALLPTPRGRPPARPAPLTHTGWGHLNALGSAISWSVLSEGGSKCTRW